MDGPNAHTAPNCTPSTVPRRYLNTPLGDTNTLWQPGPDGATHAPGAATTPVAADTSAAAAYTQGAGQLSAPPDEMSRMRV